MDMNATMEYAPDELWKEKFYAPVDDIEHMIIAIILLFLTTFGLCGNGTVIYIFST